MYKYDYMFFQPKSDRTRCILYANLITISVSIKIKKKDGTKLKLPNLVTPQLVRKYKIFYAPTVWDVTGIKHNIWKIRNKYLSWFLTRVLTRSIFSAWTIRFQIFSTWSNFSRCNIMLGLLCVFSFATNFLNSVKIFSM